VCCPAITEGGESLWPAKWSVEELRRMEAANPYVFSGQYQQRPSPKDGGLFKPDQLKPIDALPAEKIEWVRGWDLASTTTGDYTAGVKLGRLADGRLIIGDVVRLRVGPDERDLSILNACKRDGYECKPCIPQNPGQAGVTQIKYLTRQLVGYSVKSSPESGHKVVRAEPLAAQINVGNVLMLKAPWNDALMSEMRMFPNGAKDDQIDALSRGFGELIGRNPSTIFFPNGPGQFGGSHKAIPAHIQEMMASTRLPAGDVCGRCSAFDAGRCSELEVLVKENDAGCAQFMAALG
jgi:predicted phage terminase large subunit-like protein